VCSSELKETGTLTSASQTYLVLQCTSCVQYVTLFGERLQVPLTFTLLCTPNIDDQELRLLDLEDASAMN
jgi:hypothetical protein